MNQRRSSSASPVPSAHLPLGGRGVFSDVDTTISQAVLWALVLAAFCVVGMLRW